MGSLMMRTVTTSIADAVPDPQLRRLLLTQVKNLAPRPRGSVSQVSLEGRLVGAAKRINLTRDVHERIDTAIELTVGSEEISRLSLAAASRDRSISIFAPAIHLRNIEGAEERT